MTDYCSVIAHAVSRLPCNSDEARHAIYERARTALRQTLGTLDPAVLANEEAALDAAIAAVETDLLFSVMQGFVKEEVTLSSANLFVSKARACVRAVTTILIDRNRLTPQRALDGLANFFLENTNEVKRPFNAGIRPLLR
ncbi:MAG: hypothetical protein WAL37_04480 [Xanthobacteraceae bacterium]|jgi:hypothetical protein